MSVIIGPVTESWGAPIFIGQEQESASCGGSVVKHCGMVLKPHEKGLGSYSGDFQYMLSVCARDPC